MPYVPIFIALIAISAPSADRPQELVRAIGSGFKSPLPHQQNQPLREQATSRVPGIYGDTARPVLLRPLEAGFVGLQVLDLTSTRAALRTPGAYESNPIMQSPAGAVALKAGVSAALVLVMERWSKRHPRAAVVTLGAIDAAYVGLVAHNYRIAGRR
jgi:hypothetical protein